MERSTAGTKEKRSPDGLSLPNQYIILINIIWYYFKTYGKSTMKFNQQKNKMDFDQSKIKNDPPSSKRGATSCD